MSLKDAVFKIQCAVRKVGKDGYNPHTKKEYATIESVLDVLNPLFEEHKVVVTQVPRFTDLQWVLMTTVRLSDGDESEWFDMPLLGLNQNNINAMQALGSAISYARRYALVAYFKLSTTDDDDGEKTGGLTFTKENPAVKREIINHAPGAIKPSELDQYVIAIGTKHKGKKLGDLSREELASFLYWVDKNVEKKNAATVEFLEKARLFLEIA